MLLRRRTLLILFFGCFLVVFLLFFRCFLHCNIYFKHHYNMWICNYILFIHPYHTVCMLMCLHAYINIDNFKVKHNIIYAIILYHHHTIFLKSNHKVAAPLPFQLLLLSYPTQLLISYQFVLLCPMLLVHQQYYILTHSCT